MEETPDGTHFSEFLDRRCDTAFSVCEHYHLDCGAVAVARTSDCRWPILLLAFVVSVVVTLALKRIDALALTT
jgi:hypothetical protein